VEGGSWRWGENWPELLPREQTRQTSERLYTPLVTAGGQRRLRGSCLGIAKLETTIF
jgi:hypothetical protein